MKFIDEINWLCARAEQSLGSGHPRDDAMDRAEIKRIRSRLIRLVQNVSAGECVVCSGQTNGPGYLYCSDRCKEKAKR